MKYRKKPVVIEAMEFTEESKDRVFNWISCTREADHNEKGEPIIKIQTLEGDMVTQLGDYVIRGVKGEFYPCKPDIFKKTYEEV
jgi:hypothetical protein